MKAFIKIFRFFPPETAHHLALISLKILNKDINDINLDFLSQSKKDFVKTLLPLISYQNQNILLERSKLEELRDSLTNNNTLSKTDLKFLNKISKKYRIKFDNKHKYDLVNELLNRVDTVSYTHLTLPTILLV